MNEHTQRLTAVEGRLDRVEEQLTTEKAEREALQQIVVPPLTQVRQDLQLNVDYLTERLESLKARPAGGSGLPTEELRAAFGEVGDVLQSLSDGQVRFATTVLESFRTVFEADLKADRHDAKTIEAIQERLLQLIEMIGANDARLRRLEDLMRPALEGRAKIMAVEA